MIEDHDGLAISHAQEHSITDVFIFCLGLAFLAWILGAMLYSLWGLRKYLSSADSILVRTQKDRSLSLLVDGGAGGAGGAGGDAGGGAKKPVVLELVFTQDYHFGGVYGSGDGVGASLWSSGLVLSDLIVQPKARPGFSKFTSFEDKTCLELGCGLGLCSVLMQIARPRLVVATDGDLPLLPLTRKNVEANEDRCVAAGVVAARRESAAQHVEVAPLRWGNPEDTEGVLAILKEHSGQEDGVLVSRSGSGSGSGGGGSSSSSGGGNNVVEEKDGFDVLFGADIIYRPNTFVALMDTLLALAVPGHTRFVLGYKPRFPTDVMFFEMLEEYFDEECRFSGKDVPTIAHRDPEVVLIQYVRKKAEAD